MNSPTYDASPKPIPQIFNNFNSLTTKKEKYSLTPRPRKPPPRPPTKSYSQTSRTFSVFSDLQRENAQIISFKKENKPELSTLYDGSRKESYFKQCFIIEEKIGSGSFGDVYKVKSREDGLHYAVKVSRQKFRGKLDRAEKLNEVCKHEQLPIHDHLVRLYRAWEEKQRLYIQTELCNLSLSTLAETNHEISEELIWRYLVDLLKALDHLHSHNLIHLDIKPENIFISQDNLCKLGDFGLVVDANNVHNRQLSDAAEGDPKYLANEVIQGIYTKAADIFSLGITILELASDLDLPSRGQSWHMLRNGQIPEQIFSKMSADLRRIILLMMNPNYQSRPSAKELLNHPIVSKYESKRRIELKMQKYLAFIKNIANMCFFWWWKCTYYINIFNWSLWKRWRKILLDAAPGDDSERLHLSPANYNRACMSNNLDLYSDDESSDLKLVGLTNNSSFDSSFSNDDEQTFDNLSSRNLCSTVNRDPRSVSVAPRISPIFPINQDSIKSVTQRLFEFSSDEMELTENEEDDAPIQSNSITSANSLLADTSSLRYRQNIARKNLANIFEELNSSSD